jgi:hypothetical protein
MDEVPEQIDPPVGHENDAVVLKLDSQETRKAG